MAEHYTVIGKYIDDEPVVAGVILGEHQVSGGEDDEFQPWATSVLADDPAHAESLAVAEMNTQNGA